MSSFNREKCISFIRDSLGDLEDRPLDWIATFISKFNQKYTYWVSDESDIITAEVLQEFGDNLRSHHYLFSNESFSKDRFEYLMEQTLKMFGFKVSMPGKGNPGHDITINGVPVSLKTQADKSIKEDQITISKFMELGKGDWSDKDEQLEGLRERFFNHMKSYNRIFTLRCINRPPKSRNWKYELVEIPKSLMLEAKNGEFEMMHSSKQMPKPGYCRVYAKDGRMKYALYFDGGTERKLQIKALNKDFCTVHATWSFPA